MSCVALSSMLPKNVSARITLGWMMRHRLGNSILTHWPFCQNIVAKELPALYCWPPKRGPINMGCLVLVSWLIKITPMVKHFILPSVSDMLEITDGEVIL